MSAQGGKSSTYSILDPPLGWGCFHRESRYNLCLSIHPYLFTYQSSMKLKSVISKIQQQVSRAKAMVLRIVTLSPRLPSQCVHSVRHRPTDEFCSWNPTFVFQPSAAASGNLMPSSSSHKHLRTHICII